ncbi:hypothetical protein MAHJHV57_51760 [Mycobacterium avium subsp. hominissuis]
MAPREFALSTLRDIYGAALGYQVDATNLQRVLARRGAVDVAQRGQGEFPWRQSESDVRVGELGDSRARALSTI